MHNRGPLPAISKVKRLHTYGYTLPLLAALVQSRLRAGMEAVVEVVLRQRLCRAKHCGAVFWICRHCDRGQQYCSDRCRGKARHEQRRAANLRHQQSPEGKLDHRDRQRDYRRRRAQARVTDQGSQAPLISCNIPLPIFASPMNDESNQASEQDRPNPEAGVPYCSICGRSGRFVNPFHPLRAT